jgi:ubiquinone/menaquinone biosynthesis C-methylase UbiE
MSEYEQWESRYATGEYVFGTEPNYFLAAAGPMLPGKGKALVVADGEARNGVWLARQGLDVLSLDFSPAAQNKGRQLAREHDVHVNFELADVHRWSYPDATFDVVLEIFAQFSTPAERTLKWIGMRRALKPGGLLILQGYTPKQLQYATGGPKQLENLYTREMLERAFAGFSNMRFVEEEREMHEGVRHNGMSAVIGLTATK